MQERCKASRLSGTLNESLLLEKSEEMTGFETVRMTLMPTVSRQRPILRFRGRHCGSLLHSEDPNPRYLGC
jgi:hypothetical protein